MIAFCCKFSFTFIRNIFYDSLQDLKIILQIKNLCVLERKVAIIQLHNNVNEL